MIPERREMQELTMPLRQQVLPAKVREVDNKIAQKVEAYKQLAKEVTSANKFLAKQEVKLARVQQEIDKGATPGKIQKLSQQKNELLVGRDKIVGTISNLNQQWQQWEKKLLEMHADVKEIHPKLLKSLPELKKISEKVVHCFDESPLFNSKPLAELKQLKQQLWEIQGTPLENLWETKRIVKKSELNQVLGRLYMLTKSPYPTSVRKEAQKLINHIDTKKLTFTLPRPLMDLCQDTLKEVAAEKTTPKTKIMIAHLYVELERADQFTKNDRSSHYEKQGREPLEVRAQIEEMQKKLAEAYESLEKA